ncbi:electron transfer flavoprotein subunit beta/FixA family protein [Symbiobacterium thermophilum]|uniref:Electron transfer flavoprotein small subunit n=1 Tax=Symbiobacterium thermophilum TaxID=2734 RepID=A0A953I8N3_SYMTR|nr:electron transfer flavoprotein subunit beta/FixA family protein [Symbiobacterium thermophilum]MBY6276044.1 electron transfer flavoprotein subunit beta [Symbiobacterium thermophilum]
MKALVCYKWVKDEADIVVDPVNKTLKTDKAKYKISDYDRNALELGAQLNEKNNVEVISITVGQEVKSSTMDVLARGSQKAYYVEAPEVDSSITAKIIAEAVKKIGDIDLIICGEGSADQYSQQVGPRLAALLGYQLVTYASAVEINGNEITIERKLEDGIEVIKVQGPTVITVLSEINVPRIPGMKQILSAKKKPSQELSLDDLGFTPDKLESGMKVINIGPSIMERKQIRLNSGDVTIKDAATELVQLLKANKII